MTNAFGSHFPPPSQTASQYVDIEIHDGVRWVSLNDHYNYVLGARSMETTAQQLRRHTVTSEMYDGDFIVHTTKGNVNETVEVYVIGDDQIGVGDNIDKVVAAFSQPLYNVRRTYGQDVEIWRCFPAEYSIARGQVNIHNVRATVTFNVPRFPKVSRMVFE